jgi:hypothetical protein
MKMDKRERLDHQAEVFAYKQVIPFLRRNKSFSSIQKG